MSNPLLDDRLVDLLLSDVVDVDSLLVLPRYRAHTRATFDLYVGACRRVAREVLLPTYSVTDAEGPVFEDGQVRLHPEMRRAVSQLVELGMVAATRSEAVGGAQLPHSVAALAHAYLMAGNLSATGLLGLTSGAAHLIEAFGDASVKRLFMEPMYEGRWTGTMALTEPQAGSSLGDLSTKATPHEDGTYRIEGAKIFISGGDHDAAENIVHLVLARIEGAPPGTRGISLFAVPKRRPEGAGLVDNDVAVTGLIHKIGWRALPSLALAFGSEGDCSGWLVGEPHRGLRCMFQMMNEARLMVGVNAIATASVAYHESLAYARERTQGRPLGVRDTDSPPVPLVAHPDVRRMLLRQKTIVDGSLCLAAVTARYADLAEGDDEAAQTMLDLLTPVTKSFPAEHGFLSNVLSVQIHGGYGYSTEYRPEAWMRDQKLNSIHEGTTGIQGLDLLGRKVVAKGGAAWVGFAQAVTTDLAAFALEEQGEALTDALNQVGALVAALGHRGLAGDVEGMLGHSADFLELFSVLVIAWMHVKLDNAAQKRAAQAKPAPSTADTQLAQGLRQGALYWFATEVPRIAILAARCQSAERSYLDMEDAWF